MKLDQPLLDLRLFKLPTLSVALAINALDFLVGFGILVVVAQYLALHLVEGYVVTPQLYSRAIRLNPVTILFGALFFGWILGPVGLALALPMVIILRGLLVITPDTPALDALAGVEEMKPHGEMGS